MQAGEGQFGWTISVPGLNWVYTLSKIAVWLVTIVVVLVLSLAKSSAQKWVYASVRALATTTCFGATGFLFAVPPFRIVVALVGTLVLVLGLTPVRSKVA